MISERTIEIVRDRASLLDIAGEVVALKRQGSNYIGLCPFHAEKSPSFSVRSDGSFYHCFGCGVSGNVFTFLMESRGIGFPEAVEELAGRYSIPIEYVGEKRKRGGDRENKELLFRVNRAAQEVFRRALHEGPQQLMAYLKERGLRPETLETFGIGFAVPEWRGLTTKLKTRGVPEDLILKSGLARRGRTGELFDFFRGRLIFPVVIERGQIAGFGGRVIPGIKMGDEEGGPKYLNSAETPIYQKQRLLYGLPYAFRPIRTERNVYVVEGYMDVIGLYQAGVQNVVATCGTAVSEDHVRRLGRLAPRVTLLFDGDAAGRKAAARCFPMFINSGVDASVVFLPEGEDPDSIARAKGNATPAYLEGLPRAPLIDCFMNAMFDEAGVRSGTELGAAGKGRLASELASLIGRVKNVVERGELIERAALRLKINPAELRNVVSSSPRTEDKPRAEEAEPERAAESRPPVTALPKYDRELLHAAMALREQVLGWMLESAKICGALHPVTLTFLQGLRELLAQTGQDEERQRNYVREYLKSFGESWVTHWKHSYEIFAGRAESSDELKTRFEQGAQRLRNTELIRSLEDELAQCTDEAEKARLAREIVALRRESRG